MKTLSFIVVGICALAGGPTSAAEPAAAADPWSLSARYRHEFVSDGAFARQANADTLRLRAGFAPRLSNGWEAFAEAEGVVELNRRFNSGANRQTTYPLVPDARAFELNQAWVGWKGARGGVRAGRQRLALDNQRFIGNVGWRQNEQTFDAIGGQFDITARTRARAIWLNRVRRVFGDNAIAPLARERRLDGRLLTVEQGLARAGTLAGYGYWIEDKDVPGASSRTLGARWNGAWPLTGHTKWGLEVEGARQSGHARARVGGARYLRVEPWLEHAGTTYRLGYEKLGRGHERSFQAPLGTLHAFNGWADKFMVTPPGGLEDRFAAVRRGFQLGGRKGRWELAWHDFRADGGARYGRELDASVGLALRPGLQALLKLADYRSDGFARDTRKVWFQLEWSR
ncbi:hypothetical protein EBB59_03865 [Lysobacter pythonis]|uniref:Alginate export domain-containing protein n=1 Tax=Solilutibacter pythonis TaxID=2483112 RepID=A0A3M2HVM2_9GAMM|nr:alginate export family protein [Lysobacter pythonis]RMH93791.1 hypothetical protein EBB59_03865 [Lysobacter pythonis]